MGNVQSDNLVEEAKKDYERLVEEVRMRQHALENQLSVAKHMDAEEAERYLEELGRDQRYNHLLLCGNPLLAGVVHGKCVKAQEQGIEIECHVSARMREAAMPTQDLIAALGVLLDNAIEAVASLMDVKRRISIAFSEEEGRSCITVANLYPYVPYADMAKWFQSGRSSKGNGRGLGLAHVRKLCGSGKADIIYGNRETEGENEIFFTLRLEPVEEANENMDWKEPVSVKKSIEDTKREKTAGEVNEDTKQAEFVQVEEASVKGVSYNNTDHAEKAKQKSLRKPLTVIVIGLFLAAGIGSILLWRSKMISDGTVSSSGTSGQQEGTGFGSDDALSIGGSGQKEGTGLGLHDDASSIAVSGQPEGAESGSDDRKTAHTGGYEDGGSVPAVSGSDLPAPAHTTELVQVAREHFFAVEVPEDENPFYLYEGDEHAPSDGSRLLFPENDLWSANALWEDWVLSRQVVLEIYDDAGKHIGRDIYVAGGMDSEEDKGRMHSLGEDISLPHWTWSRRGQERWEYDEFGRETTYLYLKQYGETQTPVTAYLRTTVYEEDSAQQVIIEGEAEDETVRVRDLDSNGLLLREYLLDPDGVMLQLSDYAYDKEGYPLVNEEGRWQWDDTYRSAKVTDTDYFGNEQESIYVYDDTGQCTEAYYLRQGEAYRGYGIRTDHAGHIVEECNAMPILQKERLSGDYENLFYDEECTQQVQPRSYVGTYSYHAYDESGREKYRLEVDTLEGYGDLYLYQYDDAGRLAVTYDYRIGGAAMDGFVLKTQDGGHLQFTCNYQEYTLYEKSGGMWDFRQEYLTEVLKEGTDGRPEYTFLFQEGLPLLIRTPEGETDWNRSEDSFSF